MFELRYDVVYSDKIYEYYDIYKDGKPYYKDKETNVILSLEIDRNNKTIQFINETNEIINEIHSDIQELSLLIFSLYDELDIEGYEVLRHDSLSARFSHVLENIIIEERDQL